MARDPDSPFQVDITWDGVIATVTVAGELDLTTAAALTARLQEIADAHPERLVLDLSGLVFVDVAGARALDRAHKGLEAQFPVIVRALPRSAVRRAED